MADYSDTVKFEAMRMWCEGRSFSEIADYFAVTDGTIRAWKKRHEPADWDIMRAEAEKMALDDVMRTIAASRAVALRNHFTDLEAMRVRWLASMQETVVKTDRKGKPILDDNGQRIVIEKRPKEYTAREIKDMTSAYRDIQIAQRLALGIPTDYVPQAPIIPTEDTRSALADMGIDDDAMQVIGEAIAHHLTVTIQSEDDEPAELDNDQTDNEIRDGLDDDDD